MTKISFNTNSNSIINSELNELYSAIVAAKNYAGGISAPSGFRAGDIQSAVSILNTSALFVQSTVKWLNGLKNSYQNLMIEENAKVKLIEVPLYKENNLIVK